MNVVDLYARYRNDEKRNRGISAVLTLIATLGILGLLLLFGFTYQDPPPEEEGVEIALGTPDAGMKQAFEEFVASQPQQSEASEQENITQNYEEAPAIEQRNNSTPTTQNNNNPHPDPASNPVRTFSTTGRNGGGAGNEGNPGNQGAPDGGGTDPTGQGQGNSGSGTGLHGRGVAEKVFTGKANCNFDGYVMVRFTVDRSGKVLAAQAVLKGSTITDVTCQEEAEKYAKMWRFDPDPNAPEKQIGELRVYLRRQ